MTFSHGLSTNNYGPAKFIVSASAALGTHLTITSALAVASSGDTIFIRNGSYTENLTLVAGVNLVAWDGDQFTPNVTIIGNATATFAGSCSISGIRLQTNNAPFLTVSGSSATVVNLEECYLNCTNNTGISFTSSSASATINIFNCFGNIGTTGIAIFANSSAGIMAITYTTLTNTGGSSTANTISAGQLAFNYVTIANPITTSSTAIFTVINSAFGTQAQNVIALTCGGSGGHEFNYCRFSSGTASAISISNTTNIVNSIVSSSNTNAITGAGTVVYGTLNFISSSKTINTTTQQDTNGGNFTPDLKFGGVNTGITYTNRSGKFSRIGPVVFFEFTFLLSNKGAAVGTATIDGFPFTSAASDISVVPCITGNTTFTGVSPMFISFTGGTTSSTCVQGASAGVIGVFTNTAFSNTSNVFCTGFYLTA